jgi:ATP-binding cassette subfamily B protein IrtA
VLEFLRAIHVVKTFGVSARNAGELSRSVAESSSWIARLMHKNGNAFAIFQTLMTSSWIAIVPLGGYFYLKGSLSAEHLLLFLILGPQILGSASRVGYAAETLKKLAKGYERVLGLLSAPDVEGSGHARSRREGGVSFRNVTLEYEPGKVALRNVSFEAAPGTLTAIVGESGAGKSTITRLIARFWEASSGTVQIGGANVLELGPAELIGQLSFAFQDVFLFEGTVASNLRLAKPDATDAELEAACRRACAHDFILQLPQGYATEVGERGARLSGGERQRLALARSLLKDAPILILDEATSATDALTEASILHALKQERRGRTVLMVAHRLATVAHAEQILVLSHGSIVERGTHRELLERNGTYAKLWSQQMLARDWELAPRCAQAVAS